MASRDKTSGGGGGGGGALTRSGERSASDVRSDMRLEELQEHYRKVQEDYSTLVKFKSMYKKEKEQREELKRVQKELTDVARAREAK